MLSAWLLCWLSLQMNSEALFSLFQSVNRDTVNLIDSLSLLTSLVDLNNARNEADLHTDALRVLLESQEIEHAALFLSTNDTLEMAATAFWKGTCITTSQRQDDWKIYDSAADQGTIGKAVSSGQVQFEQCRNMPEYFIPFADAENERQVVVGIRQQACSLMCVPLVNREIHYGVLCLHHRHGDFFTSTHEQFFTLFSKLFIQMLLNFRYTNDLQNQVNERTGQLEEALLAARRLQQDFRNLAMLDEPTGLPNRRFFCSESQTALARALRHQHAFSCCIIEISNFKNLADHRSFFACDHLLEALADVLKMHVREGDILAYLRGEQFILSLPEISIDESRQFAQRILNLLQDAHHSELFEQMHLQVGLSTLAEFSSRCTDTALELLITRADLAMKAGQAAGKTICHYDDLSLADAECVTDSLRNS
jgi:diguanylate cyclase (GGDEF)-like protein